MLTAVGLEKEAGLKQVDYTSGATRYSIPMAMKL